VRALELGIQAQGGEAISRVIYELPSAQQISADAAAGLLDLAKRHGYAVWKAIRQLPQLGQPQLTSEELHVFLKGAISVQDSEHFSELCQHAAEEEAAAVTGGVAACGFDATQMQSLLVAALGLEGDRALQTKTAAQLFQLGAAKTLGPDIVADLMMACVTHRNASGPSLLGQLPAAAQLDQQAAEALVQQALEQDNRRTHYNSVSVSDNDEVYSYEAVLRALLRQPAVQRLAPDAVARLLAKCIEDRRLNSWLLLLRSALTAANEGAFSQNAVRQLLQLSYEVQQWDVFDWLVGLPAAPLGDEEVAMWCAVRAVISCQSSR
jgi:hypothetical protein